MEERHHPSRLPVILFLAAAVVAVAVFALAYNRGEPEQGLDRAVEGARVVVEYSVTGQSRLGSITIANETGGTEQHEVEIPWKQSFMVDRGQFVYLSVQNSTEQGTVACEIKVNGETVQEASSSDQYGIASCSGSVK